MSEFKGEFKTEQEKFWSGEFGDSYISRNNNLHRIASKVNLFLKILENTTNVQSAIEFGANIGLNLLALRALKPDIKLCGVEINPTAFKQLNEIPNITAVNESIHKFKAIEKYDLVFFKGVLIHINPEELNSTYQLAYELSKKYILVCEYYNPTPVAITYRGHSNKLFKRDFAGEILDMYKDLRLVDYGFSYHRDPNFPNDDLTWFLLEKMSI